MQAKINFNAGPAALPPEVLHEASKAVNKYKKTGLSILELSHRGPEFAEILAESKHLVKKLCGLDDSYEPLWLHGGGRQQFFMIPMNLLPQDGAAGYIDSGHWAEEAQHYAAYYGDAQILASSKKNNYNRLPEWPSKIPAKLAYVHLTTNNTIYGTQWGQAPEIKVPLIADMSSDIFSRKHDYSKYSMFYAAAQKNLGIAGVALAVIRKDLLKRTVRELPPMLSYIAQVKEGSILNTANVYGIYVSLLMLRWIDSRGIADLEKENKQKAKLLYDTLDHSSVFTPYITEKAHRSIMNVCFTAKTPETEKNFLALCEENDITGIAGHRLVGGFRASIYNAVPLDWVERLVEIMKSVS